MEDSVRPDIVDTSDQDEVIIAIPTAAIRASGVVTDELKAVIGDLILGRRVAGARLDQWGLTAIGLLTMEEAARLRALEDSVAMIPEMTIEEAGRHQRDGTWPVLVH